MERNLREIDMPYIMLSSQTALVGAVTPNLRAVTINLNEKKKEVVIFFFYDEEINEKLFDLVSTVIAEITIPYEYIWDEHITTLKCPEKIPEKGFLVYHRKESGIENNIKKIKETFQLPYTEEKYFWGNVNRAIQNALLGCITPNIREIAINSSENFIYVHFYYQGEIKEMDKNNMNQIMNIFCRSFPSYYIYLRFFRIDESPILPYHDVIAFARYEETYNNAPYHIPEKFR